jgi:ankyrin repeat protein
LKQQRITKQGGETKERTQYRVNAKHQNHNLNNTLNDTLFYQSVGKQTIVKLSLHFVRLIRSMHSSDKLIVRMLLDARAIVDETKFDGCTPLWLAVYNEHFDAARLLIDRGAKISKVKLDTVLPAIPNWVTTFIESRSNCRTTSIIIIGIHKYHMYY